MKTFFFRFLNGDESWKLFELEGSSKEARAAERGCRVFFLKIYVDFVFCVWRYNDEFEKEVEEVVIDGYRAFAFFLGGCVT